MTDNLSKTAMTSGQDQKEVSSNDGDGEIDAAITSTLSKDIDNTNGVTLTTLEMQRAVYFTFEDTGTTAACTATFPAVIRGIFAVQNSCSQTLTLTISGQAFTPPTIEDGELAIFISDGVNVKALGTGGGASGSSNIIFEDATTSTVPNVQTITRLSTGTPANGIGGTIDLRTEDDGGNTESAAAIVFRLDDVTNTSEVGAMGLGTFDASTFTEILTLKAGKAGIGSLTPLTDFEVRGPVAAGGTLTLSTAEPSVVAADELGVINFQAPVDAAGTDAILVAAAIKAIANNTFSASVNATDLVFFTAASEVATEKMRLTSVGRLVLPGFINHGAPTELTIAAGVVTATGSYHEIDTESDAATDDLDTINGGSAGDHLYITAIDGARDVVAKDNVGNLQLAGDFTMDNIEDVLHLVHNGTNWLEVSRSDNGA
jgi:hypothetical protein